MTTALLVLAAAVALGAAVTLLLWARERARKRSLTTAAGSLEELERRMETSRRRLTEADERWAALRDAGPRPDHGAVAGPADTLTQLGGRSAFLEQFARELEHAPEGACALLTLDADGYGEGSPARLGDSAVVGLAELVREAAENDGVAFRVGGDAFALIFPAGGLARAESAFARLQAALGQGVLARDVMVTGGIAAAEPGDRALEVLMRADEALRQAKREARGSAMVGSTRAHSTPP